MKDNETLLLLDRLVSALQRKGTEQDGNWGWPSFEDELREIRAAIGRRLTSQD